MVLFDTFLLTSFKVMTVDRSRTGSFLTEQLYLRNVRQCETMLGRYYVHRNNGLPGAIKGSSHRAIVTAICSPQLMGCMGLRSVHTERLRQKRYVDGQNKVCNPFCPSQIVKKIKGAARQCYGDGAPWRVGGPPPMWNPGSAPGSSHLIY